MNQVLRSSVLIALLAISSIPRQAVAGSGQFQGSIKNKIVDETLPTIIFKVKAYRVIDEKGFAICTNFAPVVRKQDVPVVVDQSQMVNALEDASKNHTLQLSSSPVMRTLVGMPAMVSQGTKVEGYSVRGQADLLDGQISVRVMTATKLLTPKDTTNSFWSDKSDGPFNLKPGQGVAIYNKGKAGKGGILTTVEVSIDAS